MTMAISASSPSHAQCYGGGGLFSSLNILVGTLIAMQKLAIIFSGKKIGTKTRGGCAMLGLPASACVGFSQIEAAYLNSCCSCCNCRRARRVRTAMDVQVLLVACRG
jgi:hypothetical protein